MSEGNVIITVKDNQFSTKIGVTPIKLYLIQWLGHDSQWRWLFAEGDPTAGNTFATILDAQRHIALMQSAWGGDVPHFRVMEALLTVGISREVRTTIPGKKRWRSSTMRRNYLE